MIGQINEEAFEYAFQRLGDWVAVQVGQPHQAEALKLLAESLGLTEDEWDKFLEWQEDAIPEVDGGSALIGLLVGLLVRQYEADNI